MKEKRLLSSVRAVCLIGISMMAVTTLPAFATEPVRQVLPGGQDAAHVGHDTQLELVRRDAFAGTDAGVNPADDLPRFECVMTEEVALVCENEARERPCRARRVATSEVRGQVRLRARRDHATVHRKPPWMRVRARRRSPGTAAT